MNKQSNNNIENFDEEATCFSCKSHFMSDMYLECYKHDRINNNSICDDYEKV